MYNDIVKDHFANPRNVREIPDATVVAEADNPVCGDILKIYLKVTDGIVVDVGVKTRGCPAAIAAGSVLTQMVRGRPLADLNLDAPAVNDALGGLPRNKQHAGDLASDALRAAQDQFNGRGVP